MKEGSERTYIPFYVKLMTSENPLLGLFLKIEAKNYLMNIHIHNSKRDREQIILLSLPPPPAPKN